MTVFTRASNGKSVSLGKQIASSGEGEVWETNQSGYLAKIYHNPTPERIEKLKVMLANPPVDPMASQNHVSIAFPQDLLKNQNGAYVGFLMPAIRQSRELTSVYNPSLRKRKAPGFNWYYLHATALNTAWIIQAIHDKGYVLGDIKPQNILVNDRALVAVIDTDSFQVRDSQTGKVYRCTVGSEGFTPVELLGKDFSTTDQTEICDRFRLGVLIHYLLFGYHPFSGQWTGSGESPEQTELIRKGFWYGGNNSLIRPSQTTIPLDVVHPEIKQCFVKCFNDGHTAPHLRPTAEDWHKALQLAINDLTACDKVDSHHYSQNYGKCYWCDRAVKLGVDIFPAVPGASSTTVKTTTTPSKATQTVSSSTPSNQTSKQSASQPLGNSTATNSSQASLPSPPPQVPLQHRRQSVSQVPTYQSTTSLSNSSQITTPAKNIHLNTTRQPSYTSKKLNYILFSIWKYISVFAYCLCTIVFVVLLVVFAILLLCVIFYRYFFVFLFCLFGFCISLVVIYFLIKDLINFLKLNKLNKN